MSRCVYTTQHGIWLDAAKKCSAAKAPCFWALKPWVMAAKFLKSGPIPILFRNTDESGEELRCHFVAELTEIYFLRDLETSARLEWLREHLWLQKSHYWEQYPQNGEEEFVRREIDKCMRHAERTCCYSVENMRKIHQFSITRLRKLSNNKPLKPNFTRPYALCYYPAEEVRDA